MQGQSSSARFQRDTPDLRRAIPRQTWLANRASNALRRPTFIGAIGVGTLVTALVSMIVVLKAQSRPPAPIKVAVRPETLSLAAAVATSRVTLAQADSTFLQARIATVAPPAEQEPLDTAAVAGLPSSDSLQLRIKALETQLARAERAPLLSSYKTLADLPDLEGDARVRALLDTLAEIERERESFGAVGGVDPIFVALTSRASEIGRAIQAIARERRTALVSQLEGPGADILPIAEPPTVDTTAMLATRDSIRLDLRESEEELFRRRETARTMDLEEKWARQRANEVAPPLALLAAALVLSGAFGFAVAFIAELKKPRIANGTELERFLGVRVLSSVDKPIRSLDRGRREADRAAPPYIDPGTEGYQLAYLGLALDQPTLLVAMITGDDPAIAAVLASNLAAVSAEEARTTLVIDLEASARVSAVLRARVAPGVADIIDRGLGWPDATTVARIGRDKTVDLVPYGSAPIATSTADVLALLRKDCLRLARYYDAIFLHGAASDVAEGLASVLPSPEVIYCAQPGLTPIRQLRAQLEQIRAAGGSIRGIVLWETERPLLAGPNDLRSPPRRDRAAARDTAIAREAHSVADA